MQLVRSGPYSPALNPNENIPSILNSRIKQEMRKTYDRMVKGDFEGRISKREWRMRILEQNRKLLTSSLSWDKKGEGYIAFDSLWTFKCD